MQSLQLYEQKLETISSKKVNEEYYVSGRASQNNNLEITYASITIDDIKGILSKQNIGWNEISKNRIVGHDYDTNVYIELFKERGSNKVIVILQKRNQNFLTITNDLQYLLMFILVICIQYWEIFILDIVSVYAKKISLMKRAAIQLLVPVRVIHYNFVSIALEDIFQSVVDCDEWTQGNTLVSDSEVHIKARDAQQSGIGLTGETVQAKNLVLDSASDINLATGKNTIDVKNTYKSSGWSVGAGISLTGGGLLNINASGNMARQNGDTHQESYVPTTIKAAQLAQLKAKRDTTIIGSTVSGKKVEVDTGRDLHIQSLQDVDNFKEHSKSAGFSVSSKPNFKDPTGSISASVGRIDSKWKSVTHQAGIYAGEDGYDIHVGNGTTLEGAVIKSDAPKAKNMLTTKSLEMKDIQNEAEYTYSNNGIGYNYYGSKKKLEEMKTNDKKGYDKIYNSIGLVPNLGVGSKGKASSTTQSAISDGILTVDGKQIDTKTINTNTENTLHQLDKIFDKKKIEERQELARLFAKNAYEQLHNWQPTTKEGKIAKAFAHGVIGEWAARMAGNAPGSGFKATMTNELLIEKIKQIADNDPALAQWLSAAVGGVVNKVTGGSVNTGAAVSSYSTKWNELAQNAGDREIVRESEVPVNVREFYKEYKEDVEGSIARKATEEAIKQLAKYNIRNDIGQVKIYFNVYDGVRFLGRVSLVVTVADTAYRIGEFKYDTQPRTDEERKNWLEFYEFDK